MNDRVRVRLLLARYEDDDTPVVIGCVDRTIWDHWDDTDELRWRRDAQQTFGADMTDYELREVWADFPARALAGAFAIPIIGGSVAAPSPEVGRDE